METKTVRALFERQVEAFTGSPEFAALEAGCGDYDAFIENVARAHLKSPQLVAFLYALAPPAAARDLLGNLLEELGLEAESERPHPALLEDLLRAAGLGHRLVEVEAQAADDVRRIVTEPLLYGALREVGLAALTEIVAFEFMLSRVSGRMPGRWRPTAGWRPRRSSGSPTTRRWTCATPSRGWPISERTPPTTSSPTTRR